jgi:hypothetical protein
MSAKDSSDKWRFHDNFMKLHKKAFPDLTFNASQQKEAQRKWKEVRDSQPMLDQLMNQWSLKANEIRNEITLKKLKSSQKYGQKMILI